MMKLLLQLPLLLLPWRLRRVLLRLVLGFHIHPTARVGWSLISAQEVSIGPHCKIGSLTLIRGLRRLVLEEHSLLGNLNWISATPPDHPVFFRDAPDRDPSLIVRANSTITHRHLIDCTDCVEVQSFTTIGGWGSQILTHSIDLKEARQRAAPVRIGEYCFVGTRVVILKGAKLPHHSVLAAGSVLNVSASQPYGLYSGTPATFARRIPEDADYFGRTEVGVY